MSGEVVPCVTKVPDYEIRDGNMFISAGEWSMCMPLRTFELGMAKASVAIAKYRAERGEVVEMPLRGRSRR